MERAKNNIEHESKIKSGPESLKIPSGEGGGSRLVRGVEEGKIISYVLDLGVTKNWGGCGSVGLT